MSLAIRWPTTWRRQNWPSRVMANDVIVVLCRPIFGSGVVRCLWTARSGKSASDHSTAVFNIDNQSERELRQYLSSIANRCIAKSTADDADGDDGDGEELPAVIILDGLHRITTPLGDIFASLLDVELCNRSVLYRPSALTTRPTTCPHC